MKILGRDCTLSRLLAQTLAAVQRLDPKRDGGSMFEQLAHARPDMAAAVTKGRDGQPNAPAVQAVLRQALGAGIVMKVKEMPAVVDQLIQRIDDRRTPPALRCALLGTLALVVQPRDIVPDDAPGGYGFIDDVALINAAALLVLQVSGADAKAIESMRQSVDFLQTLVPEAARPAMQAALQGVALSFQLLGALPTQMVELTAAQLLDHPLQASTPAPPPGWQSPLPAPSAGHWSHGAWFEGNDVVIPGGPSLIGGQVFIPD